MVRSMNEEAWVQGLPMVAASVETSCATCQHRILDGGKCAQRCCGTECLQLRREVVHLPRGFH